jgi:hypothetical protein
MTQHENDLPATDAPGIACCGGPAAAPAHDESAGAPQTGEVLIISDSCCNPAAVPAEERAVKTVADAISASGTQVSPRLVSATDALGGALSPEILAKIQSHLARGTAQPPMVMIDGEVVASGTFTQKEVEAALATHFGASA